MTLLFLKKIDLDTSQIRPVKYPKASISNSILYDTIRGENAISLFHRLERVEIVILLFRLHAQSFCCRPAVRKFSDAICSSFFVGIWECFGFTLK